MGQPLSGSLCGPVAGSEAGAVVGTGLGAGFGVNASSVLGPGRHSGHPARIGLFGGSFNPPHLGHLALARAAMQALDLHELRWLPAGQPWQKAGQAMAPAEHRAAMVTTLMRHETGMRLDERELRRAGPTYTADTVAEVQAEALARTEPREAAPQWFLLLGQDQLARLPTWHRVREWLPQVHLAVAAREGQAPLLPPELAGLPAGLHTVPMPRLDISSTTIRQRVAAGQPVSTLAGPEVARYIDQHRLYRAI